MISKMLGFKPFTKYQSRMFSAGVKVGPTQLLINGKFVNYASGKTFETINPSDGKVITQVQEAGVEDATRAVNAARLAFDEGPWRREDPKIRSRILHKIADKIEQNIDELAALETLDNGKPLFFAKMDIGFAIEILKYYAGWPDKIVG